MVVDILDRNNIQHTGSINSVHDVKSFHIEQMASRSGDEQIRNFHIDMAQKFGVEVFVNLWNKEFNNIHGTYNRQSDTEIWYSVINDDLKLNTL